MKKRILSILATCVLTLTVFTPAAAAYDLSDYEALSNVELAYCDLDTAPAELQDDILTARAAIIYSESWSADGLATVTYPDGTTEVLPKFSDLFPDWDIPAEDVSVLDQPSAYAMTRNFAGNVSIAVASDTVLASLFYTFTGTGGSVALKVSNFAGSTYNAGLTNLVTGKSLVWTTRIPTGSTVTLPGAISGVRIGVRVSTYSTPGSGYAEVWH